MATGIAIVARPDIAGLENILAIDPARNRSTTTVETAPIRLADDLHINHVIGVHDRAALD